jgi:hypothetical protein
MRFVSLLQRVFKALDGFDHRLPSSMSIAGRNLRLVRHAAKDRRLDGTCANAREYWRGASYTLGAAVGSARNDKTASRGVSLTAPKVERRLFLSAVLEEIKIRQR